MRPFRFPRPQGSAATEFTARKAPRSTISTSRRAVGERLDRNDRPLVDQHYCMSKIVIGYSAERPIPSDPKHVSTVTCTGQIAPPQGSDPSRCIANARLPKRAGVAKDIQRKRPERGPGRAGIGDRSSIRLRLSYFDLKNSVAGDGLVSGLQSLAEWSMPPA
jgi:hypothetical protein